MLAFNVTGAQIDIRERTRNVYTEECRHYTFSKSQYRILNNLVHVTSVFNWNCVFSLSFYIDIFSDDVAFILSTTMLQ